MLVGEIISSWAVKISHIITMQMLGDLSGAPWLSFDLVPALIMRFPGIESSDRMELQVSGKNMEVLARNIRKTHFSKGRDICHFEP